VPQIINAILSRTILFCSDCAGQPKKTAASSGLDEGCGGAGALLDRQAVYIAGCEVRMIRTADLPRYSGNVAQLGD